MFIHLTNNETQHQILVNCIELLLIILTFTMVFNGVESNDYSFSESLYFTLATLSTVGYGDIHPTTFLGYLCSIIMILFMFLWLPERVSLVDCT